MKLKFSSRRHYGNMDTEAAPGLGLEMQQPPAVFADGNVVAANGQNMNFNNQPAVLDEHVQIVWQPPSCASRCSLACGVIFFVVLTAIFSAIAETIGALLPFSSGPNPTFGADSVIFLILCRRQFARHRLHQRQQRPRNGSIGNEWLHAHRRCQSTRCVSHIGLRQQQAALVADGLPAQGRQGQPERFSRQQRRRAH
jgi:hypothetical protein